jgi:acyl carrier protein
MTSGIKERIRDFVTRELLVESGGMSIADDTLLMDEALIDSMGVFSLATFIENEFGIEVRDRDLVPEHFGSITAIARFVETRRAERG